MKNSLRSLYFCNDYISYRSETNLQGQSQDLSTLTQLTKLTKRPTGYVNHARAGHQ